MMFFLSDSRRNSAGGGSWINFLVVALTAFATLGLWFLAYEIFEFKLNCHYWRSKVFATIFVIVAWIVFIAICIFVG